MKAYVTKFWETNGIEERDLQQSIHTSLVMDSAHRFYHKTQWYESLDDAKAHAETLRLKKIKALENKLARLKALKF